MRPVNIQRTGLINSATRPTTGPWTVAGHPEKTVQATFQGQGTATVRVEVSNDGTNALLLGTITVDAATPSDGFISDTPWVMMRAVVLNVSPGASVSCMIGEPTP